MTTFKIGDCVWVQAGYSKPREAVIMKFYEQSAEVCFVLTKTYCVMPLTSLRSADAFTVMGDNNDNI